MSGGNNERRADPAAQPVLVKSTGLRDCAIIVHYHEALTGFLRLITVSGCWKGQTHYIKRQVAYWSVSGDILTAFFYRKYVFSFVGAKNLITCLSEQRSNRGEWGRLQHGLFLQSGMIYSDDIHTAHAKSAPHPSWMKSGTCDHSLYKKIIFMVKKHFFYNWHEAL